MFKKEGIWTTLGSLLIVILTVLVTFGVITTDQKEALKFGWDQLMLAIPGGDVTAIIAAVLVIAQIVVGFFVKDPKKGGE